VEEKGHPRVGDAARERLASQPGAAAIAPSYGFLNRRSDVRVVSGANVGDGFYGAQDRLNVHEGQHLPRLKQASLTEKEFRLL
jgi:hypothetical protein